VGLTYRQVLTTVSEALHSDVFAVSQQVARSGVISVVKAINVKSNEKWKESTEIFQKVHCELFFVFTLLIMYK
jgi:hypothetical protein